MVMERLKLVGLRAVAWWIDAFLVGGTILLLRWLINAVFDSPLTGQAGALYDIVALAVLFFAYRVTVETKYASSLGKWSMKLEVITPHRNYWGSSLRNSWLLLTALGATGIPNVETALLALVGFSCLLVGRHPFDMAASAFVEPKLGEHVKVHNPWKREV